MVHCYAYHTVVSTLPLALLHASYDLAFLSLVRARGPSFFLLQFVIVAAFDQTDPSMPVEERVALGLKRCGVSVTCKFFPFRRPPCLKIYYLSVGLLKRFSKAMRER